MTDATDRAAPQAVELGELPAIRRRLLAGLLRHAPFDGWSQKALQAAARDGGIAPELVAIAFPGGLIEAAEFYSREADRQMVEALQIALAVGHAPPAANPPVQDPTAPGPGKLKIREKVALAVRTRLLQQAPNREALRALASFLALPAHAGRAAAMGWRTVDAMWHAIGDRSTDFNYYSKRALLAGIYGSTVLVWLDDRSDGAADSLAFLDRRIGDAMAFERAKVRCQQVFNGFFGRRSAAGRWPGPRAPASPPGPACGTPPRSV